MSNTEASRPGPPFQVGETVAFFPGVVGPTSNWLVPADIVLVEINDAAETFKGHFVSRPDVLLGQGLEQVARRTPTYEAWRAAWEAAFARAKDEAVADEETRELWWRVRAEHPILGVEDASREHDTDGSS